jgi:serine/threonine protein kinase
MANQFTSVSWPIGSRIKGRYEVLDIKQGGMASVYLCYDHEFRDYIAVKTFQDRFLKERSVVDRFLREAEYWMRLEKHKNIVSVRWIDKINSRPCIFMEYIYDVKDFGADLSGWIGKKELTIELIIRIAIQICTGLIYVQRKFIQLDQEFVHRDLKPANIMMMPDGSPKITDFGLIKIFAKDIEESIESNNKYTITTNKLNLSRIDEIFGAPGYMAPEQWISSHNVDFRADIYSLGCTLYEMITGRTPFIASSFQDLKIKHLSHPPQSFGKLGLGIPAELDRIVMKCLAKNPNDRFQSFEDIRNELVDLYYNLTGQWFEYSDKAEDLSIADNSNIAMSLLELGKNQEALRYYDRLLGQMADNLDPNNVARVFNNRGNCHSNLGDNEKALTNYELALKIDADYDFPWFNSAGIYKRRGDFKKALKYVEESIRINPDYPPAHSQRADILFFLGNLREAIYECGIAIKMDPIDPWTYEVRAKAYENMGDFDNAEIDRNKAKQLRGNL